MIENVLSWWLNEIYSITVTKHLIEAISLLFYGKALSVKAVYVYVYVPS